MFTIGFTPETIRLLADFRHRVRGLASAVSRGAWKTARELERSTKENLSGDLLNVRSGALRRSIEAGVILEANQITVYLGSVKGPASAYSRAQEEGRTITPVSAQWLAIPVGPALTGAGVARFASPRECPVEFKFIKVDSDTAVLVSTGAWNYTFGRAGTFIKRKGAKRRDKKRGEVWYVLVKRVRMPATYWLTESITGGEQLLANWVQQSVYNHLTRRS